MKPLDLSPEANWRKRFRAAHILWAVTAQRNPSRGLVCTNDLTTYFLDLEYLFYYNFRYGYSAQEKIFTDRLTADKPILSRPGFPLTTD